MLLHLHVFPLLLALSATLSSHPQSELLLQIKASLDPQNQFLLSWSVGGDPCAGPFEGVGCNEMGRVLNISLQGRGLSGRIPAAIGALKTLNGLYLHFNNLNGEIPQEIAELSELSELYLNVNNLSGEIPHTISQLSNLQVLQLSYNSLSGSIPGQLGSLKKLSVLALQHNQLAGAIPASLGDLRMLTRLDLSFNQIFGSLPSKLANAPNLRVLDVQNNSLSGNIPSALKRLHGDFLYDNNKDLCGVVFSDLKPCATPYNSSDLTTPKVLQPRGAFPTVISSSTHRTYSCHEMDCSSRSRSVQYGVIFAVTGAFVALFVGVGFFIFLQHNHAEQKIGNDSGASDGRRSNDDAKDLYLQNASPLVNVEYSAGWDPSAKGWLRTGAGSGDQLQVMENLTMFNLEEVERATQGFSEANLLGKSSFSATYKGILRDGSVVAVRRVAKTSCKPEEDEFLNGLKTLSTLKHDHLVKLRGFCCSKGWSECFIIHDFVPNGNLWDHLVANGENAGVVDWLTRTSIIHGIAKGIRYLHCESKEKKPVVVHQNLSAENVLMDGQYNPLLSKSGLHKLLADDIVFSMLKASAAKGYLAPEYTTTGRFTEKSDVYAFGIILLQILTGKLNTTEFTCREADSWSVEDFIDPNLNGNFLEIQAIKLGAIARLCCHESADRRPTMDVVVDDLTEIIALANS